MRSLITNTHDINEYINFEMYLLGKNGINIILIKREFYIVDNLTTKTLIDIDILKPEGIVLDII